MIVVRVALLLSACVLLSLCVGVSVSVSVSAQDIPEEYLLQTNPSCPSGSTAATMVFEKDKWYTSNSLQWNSNDYDNAHLFSFGLYMKSLTVEQTYTFEVMVLDSVTLQPASNKKETLSLKATSTSATLIVYYDENLQVVIQKGQMFAIRCITQSPEVRYCNNAGGRYIKSATAINSFEFGAASTNKMLAMPVQVKPYVASTIGDPQFTGFRSQQYQIHGIPNTNYSVISTPSTQLNAQFVFLDSAICPSHMSQSECFTHPGTFLGQVALIAKVNAGRTDTRAVHIQSGPAADGLRVFIDGDEYVGLNDDKKSDYAMDLISMQPIGEDQFYHMIGSRGGRTTASASTTAPIQTDDGYILDSVNEHKQMKMKMNKMVKMTRGNKPQSYDFNSTSVLLLRRSSPFHVHVYTSDFSFRFDNSDKFINQHIDVVDMDRLTAIAKKEAGNGECVHGLLGQTVEYKTYDNKWRFVEGDVSEYGVSSLFSFDDSHNCFSRGAAVEVEREDF